MLHVTYTNELLFLFNLFQAFSISWFGRIFKRSNCELHVTEYPAFWENEERGLWLLCAEVVIHNGPLLQLPPASLLSRRVSAHWMEIKSLPSNTPLSPTALFFCWRRFCLNNFIRRRLPKCGGGGEVETFFMLLEEYSFCLRKRGNFLTRRRICSRCH